MKLRRFFFWCRPYLEKFSRRKDFWPCKFEQSFPTDEWHQSGRYWALNPNSSQETYEVRLFRGTLCYETLRASVEMVDAIGQFVHGRGTGYFNWAHSGDMRIPKTKKVWSDFCKFIEREGRWEYLKNKIKTMEIKESEDS